LRSRITDEWLDDDLIKEQGLFDVQSIQNLKTKLFSVNPGDSHATVWALIVFQSWYNNYLA
jgi:asparagine synthase (glutamine-hydrolysing)